MPLRSYILLLCAVRIVLHLPLSVSHTPPSPCNCLTEEKLFQYQFWNWHYSDQTPPPHLHFSVMFKTKTFVLPSGYINTAASLQKSLKGHSHFFSKLFIVTCLVEHLIWGVPKPSEIKTIGSMVLIVSESLQLTALSTEAGAVTKILRFILKM